MKRKARSYYHIIVFEYFPVFCIDDFRIIERFSDIRRTHDRERRRRPARIYLYIVPVPPPRTFRETIMQSIR